MKNRKALISFILILFSGLFAGIFRELKIFPEIQEVVTILFLILICIFGFIYWKSQNVKWIINLWLLIYSVSILIFLICSIGYRFLGWNSPYSKHILPTLSPVTFVILYLINRLANMEPNIKIDNKI